MNHLFIQTAFLGDLLLSIPAIKQIRYWDSKSQLTLVCRKGYGSFFKELGLVDEVIELDKSNKSKIFDELNGKSFGHVFCPHQSVTSHKIVKAVRADKKLGYKKVWNSSYFDIRVKRRLDWPEAMRQLQLVAAVDESTALKLEAFSVKDDSIPAWAQMSLNNLRWSEAKFEKLVSNKAPGFKHHSPYICLAPGSVWPTKRWSSDHYVKSATELVRQGYQVLVLGAPDERELCEKIKMHIPNSYSLAGHLNIFESLMILSKAKGLICNDSGAMHMASVVDTPTVAVFGPTVQELGYKPWSPKAKVVENEELLCRPCGQHGTKACPIKTHQCMTSIKPKQLVQEALATFG